MQPYRLEMGTAWAPGRKKNLYDWWGRSLSDALIEDLAGDETNDNIVAMWVPKAPARAGNEYQLKYRLHRSEAHTSELHSLLRISYAVLCLKKHNTTYVN